MVNSKEDTAIPLADDFNSLKKNRPSALNRRLNGLLSRDALLHSGFIFGSEIMFQLSKHQAQSPGKIVRIER